MMGLMLMMPWPPLPAGTLLGTTAFSIVIVNCGVTASTVRFSGGVVCVPVEAVPVIVTV